MRDFFEDLGKKLTETAETVGKRTEEVMEIQRLKSQIRTMERSNDRDLYDLGKMVFEKYKDGEILDGEYFDSCQDISGRIKDIRKFEEEIALLRGIGVCPECQRHVEKGMIYCPYCGCKFGKDKPFQADDEEDVCQETEQTAEQSPEQSAEPPAEQETASEAPSDKSTESAEQEHGAE